MSRLFYLHILLFIHSALYPQNNVRLVCADGSLFKVYMNEKPVNKQPQANVLVEHVTEDTLYLKVEFENSIKGGLHIFLLDKGLPVTNKELNYRIAKNKNRIMLDYLASYEIVPLPDPLVPKPLAVDTSNKYRNIVLGHFCEIKEEKPVYFNNLPKEGRCLEPMPAEYLNYAQLLLKKTYLQEEKFTVAENVSRNNCLSTAQLSTLLTYIDYEIEKLRLVRLAYYNLTDVQNQKSLEKSFKLDASVNELNNFFAHAGDLKVREGNTCVHPSPEEEMRKLADNLSAFMGDAQRLEVLKHIYNNYCYSVDQVIFILQKFVHDRERSEAARLLYFNCIEKNKFEKVTEVFSYAQYANELKEFLAKQTH